MYFVLDIDDFKHVNDNYGHNAGDIILRSISYLIMHYVKMPNIAFRYGGEEFLVIYDGDINNAIQFAEGLRQLISHNKYEITQGFHLYKSISIGVVERLNGESAHDVFNRVDLELYRAKKYGKNRVSY